MSNENKLIDVFADSLSIERVKISDDLYYNSIPEWDSVGHMSLVSSIETGFDVMFDSDDVIDMSSFAKAKEILVKHGIEF